mgnify:CR=1 FL=1
MSVEQGKDKGAVRGSEEVVEGLPHSIGRKHGGPPSIYMRMPTRAVWEAKYRKGSKRTGLNPTQLQVLTALCGYANNQGFAWPSRRTMAEVVEISEVSVTNSLKKCEALGYIEKVSKHKSHPKWKHVFSTVWRIIYDNRMDTDELIDAMEVEEPTAIAEDSIPLQSEEADDVNHGDERGEEQLVEVSGVARWYAAEVSRITGELRLVNPNAIDAAARAIEAIGVDRVKADAHDALIICRDIRKPAPLNLLFLAER